MSAAGSGPAASSAAFSRQRPGLVVPTIAVCTPGTRSVNRSAVADGSRRGLAQELVVEPLEPLPVGLVVGVAGRSRVAPGGVGDRPLGDHAHAALAGQRQRQVDRLLVGDADRGLERVEGAALDGVARRRPSPL